MPEDEPDSRWWIGIAFVPTVIISSFLLGVLTDYLGFKSVSRFLRIVFMLGGFQIIFLPFFLYPDKKYVGYVSDWVPSKLFYLPSVLLFYSVVVLFVTTGIGLEPHGGRIELIRETTFLSTKVFLIIGVAVALGYLLVRYLVLEADFDPGRLQLAKSFVLIVIVLIVAGNLGDPDIWRSEPYLVYSEEPGEVAEKSLERLAYTDYEYTTIGSSTVFSPSVTRVENDEKEYKTWDTTGTVVYSNDVLTWRNSQKGPGRRLKSSELSRKINVGQGWYSYSNAAVIEENSTRLAIRFEAKTRGSFSERKIKPTLYIDKSTDYPSKIHLEKRDVTIKITDVGNTEVTRPGWAPLTPEEVLIDALDTPLLDEIDS